MAIDVTVNWTILGTIYSTGNKIVTGVKFKAALESKLNDSPDMLFLFCGFVNRLLWLKNLQQ